MKEMNPDTMVKRMAAEGLLSKNDQDFITIGHSLHHKNALLLSCVQKFSIQALQAFCELVQELWPMVGTQLLAGI